MTWFQIIVLVFILFVFAKIFRRYQEKIISSREMFLWGLFWVVAGLIIIWPGTTSFLAGQLGIGRGVDLVIYIGLILNFYMIFKLVIRIEKHEKNFSELIRRLAIKDELDKKKVKET